MCIHLSLAVLTCVCAVTLAQQPRPTPVAGAATPRAQSQSTPRAAPPAGAPQDAAADDEQAPLRVVEYGHDEERSRALFGACDASGDDRLDLFEAQRALGELGDPTSPGWFRRLDGDRDGYLEWPEFDAFFAAVVHAGNALHLRLVRAAPARPVRTARRVDESPAARLLDLFDADRDGLLDRGEMAQLLEQLGLPPTMAAMTQMLDADRNGKLSLAELAPALQQFQVGLFAARGNRSGAAQLTEPWTHGDADGSADLDGRELAALLRRIDPELERWAAALLQHRDADGDGRLAPAELTAPEPDAVDQSGARAPVPARR